MKTENKVFLNDLNTNSPQEFELTPFTCLIGYNCIKFSIGKGCLVNAQLRTGILREKDPLLCMGLLVPGMKITQMFFILLPKVIPVDVIMFF